MERGVVEILRLVVSNFFTWFGTHSYYKKSQRTTPKLLTDEVKNIILSRPKDVNWSAKEIVKLYQSKIFSEEANNELGLLYCPYCGSEKLQEGYDETYYFVKCQECGMKESVSIEDLLPEE